MTACSTLAVTEGPAEYTFTIALVDQNNAGQTGDTGEDLADAHGPRRAGERQWRGGRSRPPRLLPLHCAVGNRAGSRDGQRLRDPGVSCGSGTRAGRRSRAACFGWHRVRPSRWVPARGGGIAASTADLGGSGQLRDHCRCGLTRPMGVSATPTSTERRPECLRVSATSRPGCRRSSARCSARCACAGDRSRLQGGGGRVRVRLGRMVTGRTAEGSGRQRAHSTAWRRHAVGR